MTSAYLSVWNACNLKCKFCYNDLNRKEKNYFKPLKDSIFTIKKIRKNFNYIIIVWWEPFLHPDILKILSYINLLKFEFVWIVTNWIKLADIWLWIKLFQLWVTTLQFSIHGNSSVLENNISWINELNFKKREKGIKNIISLNGKLKENISLTSNTVINSINYKFIIQIINYITELWLNEISISFVYNLKGLSSENKKMLVKYSDVIDIFNKSKDDFWNTNLSIEWLPYCLHKKIKNIKYKIREEKDYYNMKEKYNDLDQKNLDKKSKLKDCKKCTAYWKFCFWVYNEYIKKFWELEFKAVK